MKRPSLIACAAVSALLVACGQNTSPSQTGTLPPSSAPPAGTPPVPGTGAIGVTPVTSQTQRLLELVNAARAQARTCGTSSYPATTPLTYSGQLEQAAQAHASDMAARDYFAHTSLDGRTPQQRVSATGYAWKTLAENISAGYTTPEDALQSWLGSPGHCANIMNPNLREIGLGYAQNASSTYHDYWVQDFGAR